MGNGVAIVVFPILYESLINTYSWRGALLITSALVLNLCVCGLLADNAEIRRNKRDAFGSCDTKGIAWHFQIWNDPRFVLLLSNAFVHCFSYSIYFTFAYTHMINQGVETPAAAWVFTSYGLSSLFSRLSTGFLDNRNRMLRRWHVFGYGHLLAGVAVLSFALLQTSNSIYYSLMMGIIGLANGLIDPLICCSALDVLGPQKFADSFSFLMCFWGIGGFSGAALGGQSFPCFLVGFFVADAH